MAQSPAQIGLNLIFIYSGGSKTSILSLNVYLYFLSISRKKAAYLLFDFPIDFHFPVSQADI